MKNEARVGDFVVGGQPDRSDLENGKYGAVVNLRLQDEAGNVTGDLVQQVPSVYAEVPLTISTITREHIHEIRAAVDAAGGPVLIH